MDSGQNPYISSPGGSNFKPWDEYRVTVDNRQGTEIKRRTVEHFYSYWQAHQLFYIQKFPDLFKNAWLIEHIPEEVKERFHLPRSHSTDLLAKFKGMSQLFDALSFWIIVYGREQSRTFANIPEANGIRRLSNAQADDYRRRLAVDAEMVTQRFHLTRDALYRFLRDLIGLLHDYQGNERYHLAEELKKDIFCLEDLIEFITGDARDKISEELGKLSIHDKRTFRHLVIATRERDYASDFLKNVAKVCNGAIQTQSTSGWSFTNEDINHLLDYCDQEGLGLFPTALSGMVANGAEESRRNFRRVNRYSNLKNILTAYEYLLKRLAVSNTFHLRTGLLDSTSCQGDGQRAVVQVI